MASGGKRGGAGERVLESRHVIGLFMLMLLFSGVFFTLGYVMGRNQIDSPVRAATDFFMKPENSVLPKAEASSKRANNFAPANAPEYGCATEFRVGVLSRRRQQEAGRPFEIRFSCACAVEENLAGTCEEHGATQNRRCSIEGSERSGQSKRRLHSASVGAEERIGCAGTRHAFAEEEIPGVRCFPPTGQLSPRPSRPGRRTKSRRRGQERPRGRRL